MAATQLQDTNICPHCETRNAEGAVLCHFCGETLPPPSSRERELREDPDPLGTRDPVLENVRGMHGAILRWFKRDEVALGLGSATILTLVALMFFGSLLLWPLLLLIAFFFK